MYVGEETSFADTSEDFEMTSEDVVSVLTDGSKIRFTALAAGTTTVTTASDTYAITVNPIPAGTSNPTSIFADLACTSRPLSSNGSKTVTIARDILINKPKFIDELAPSTATDGSVMHYFWKARVIERSMTDGGQDLDEYADNEDVYKRQAEGDGVIRVERCDVERGGRLQHRLRARRLHTLRHGSGHRLRIAGTAPVHDRYFTHFPLSFPCLLYTSRCV